MSWTLIESELGDGVVSTTSALKVGSRSVLVRVQSITSSGDIAESITSIPNCRLIVGGCGEKGKLAPYTGT